MSRIINISDTLTFIPSSFDNVNSNIAAIDSSNGAENGLTNSNSSTRAAFTSNTAANSTTSIYYNFDCSSIPQGATIVSISCSFKAVASSSYFNTRICQLCSGTTKKGSGTTITNTSINNTVNEQTIADTGSWTRQELNNIKILLEAIRGSSTNAFTISFYGATLTINYEFNGILYSINSELDTNNINSISPEGLTEVSRGDSYELNIYGNSINNIQVLDNNVDVKNLLVQHQVTQGDITETSIPQSNFETGLSVSNANFYISSSTSTTQRLQDAIGHSAESPATQPSSNQWTYVKDNNNNTATGWAIYSFDFSAIPQNAIIQSVEVKCYGARENTTVDSTHKAMIGLYSGTTLKSTEQEFTSTSASIITISNPGTWTRSELQNAKLRFTVAYYGGWIGGITWNVVYKLPDEGEYYWTYTLNGINKDHDILITDTYSGTKYDVDTRLNTQIATVNTQHRSVKENDPFTLIIYCSNIDVITIKDNGSDIKDFLTGDNGTYYYTISSVNTNHTIIITENTWYSISGESTYEDATISISSNKVYENNSVTITVNVSNISLIHIFDNNTNVTSSFSRVSNGVYSMTISNVIDDHEFIVLEANKYSITGISNTNNATINPNGLLSVSEGDSVSFKIFTNLNQDVLIVKDNNVDVSNSLIYVTSSTETVTRTDSIGLIPSGTTGSSNISTNNTYPLSNGYNGVSNTSNYARLQLSANNTTTQCYIYYTFDIPDIPSDATITSVSCTARLYINNYVSSSKIQLYSNTTAKGSSTSISNTSASNITISNTGSWTVNELNNLRLIISGQRSNTNNNSYIYFYGADITINYTYNEEISIPSHYQYILSNVNSEHTVSVFEVFVPEEEDPQTTYHSLSISSINASTNPQNGTMRVEEGDEQTIIIHPHESQLTLITDNGLDVSDLLVSHGLITEYNVTEKVSNASYGFTLNSSTGYYTSTNNGVASSASVCRVNFNLSCTCLITIEYINYAEATYDFGVFGKVDTTLSISGWTASQNSGDTTTDAGLEQLRCNTNALNSASSKTLTYEISSGQHYIDIKYGKDQSTDSYNDSLQWKIISIQPIGEIDDSDSEFYYTYTLNNINEDHSLIFIFGEVEFYTTTSNGTGCRLFPSGDFVTLPNESYSITIIPNGRTYSIEIYDNGKDVTKSLTLIENESVKSYIYTIKKVKEDHILNIRCSQSELIYIKINGTYTEVSQVFKKINDVWTEIQDYEYIFEPNKVYIKK